MSDRERFLTTLRKHVVQPVSEVSGSLSDLLVQYSSLCIRLAVCEPSIDFFRKHRSVTQSLLRRLLLRLIIVGVTNQTVTNTLEHVHDVVERLIHLPHRVVRSSLSLATPSCAGDVHRRR